MINQSPDISDFSRSQSPEGDSAYSRRLKARKVECQVAGCTESLPTSTAYHKCGRFHPLSDFDGDRRSCKKKLAVHKDRRKESRRNEATSSRPTGSIKNTSVSSRRDTASAAHLSSYSYASVGADHKSNSKSRGDSPRPSPQERDAEEENLPDELPGIGPLELDNSFDLDNILYQLNVDTFADSDLLPLNNLIAPLQPPMPSNNNGISSTLEPRAAVRQSTQPVSLLDVSLDAPVQLRNAASALRANNPTSPPLEFYASSDLVRVSFKLFNVHPHELPATIYKELQAIIQDSSSIYLNARFGCTYLTADALLSPEKRSALKSLGSRHILQTAALRGSSLFPEKTFEGPEGKVIAQLGEQASIIHEGLDITVNTSNLSSATPVVTSVIPLAAVAGDRIRFGLYGSSIAAGQCMVICRRGPSLPDLEVVRSGLKESSTEEYVEFVLPRPAEGLHFVEVQRGSLLSTISLPFLILDSVDAVKELRQLEYDTAGIGNGQEGVASFLQSVGVVLDWLRKRDSNTNEPTPGYKSYITTQPQSGPETAEVIASLAQRVAATCIGRAWPALLRLVLPAIIPPGANPDTVVEAFKSFSNGNLPLLHLAVLSRCPKVVDVLAEWSRLPTVNYIWSCEGLDCATGAPTPLHLATLLEDEGRMAASLTSLFFDDFSLWSHRGVDGDGDGSNGSVNVTTVRSLSPADFAIFLNKQIICSWLKKNGVPLDYSVPETTRFAAGSSAGGGSSQPLEPVQYASKPMSEVVATDDIGISNYLAEIVSSLTLKTPEPRGVPRGVSSTMQRGNKCQILSRKTVIMQCICITAATGLAFYARNAFS